MRPLSDLPMYRRFAGMGTCCGVIGGFCCIGKAVAVGAGLGASSFLVTLMESYQSYLIAASLGAMALWIGSLVTRHGLTLSGLRAAARLSWRHAAVCMGTYVVVLALTMSVMAVIDHWAGVS